MHTKISFSVTLIANVLRRVTAYLQGKGSSFKRHDAQYRQFSDQKILELKAHFEKWERENNFNNPYNRLGDLLDQYASVRNLAIDIGAGAGWLSAKLAKDYRFDRIVAIEPSQAAIEIALKLYPKEQFSNIEWVKGFAEQELVKIKPTGPALFVTGVVMSHLRDREVQEICKAINTVAPLGSVLGFVECWGNEWHQKMWHCRTKEWWQGQLPGWKFYFYGPEIPDQPGRHLGFHAEKVSNSKNV